MTIDQEVDFIFQRWEREEREQQERVAEATREKLRKRRADLLSGEWKPPCTCRRCVRAVLAMDPTQVCKNAASRGVWWQ